MSGFYFVQHQKVLWEDVFLNEAASVFWESVFLEQEFAAELQKWNLPFTNKILMYGASGCGKTYTAKAVATRLQKKLLVVNLAQIVSSRLGETAKNLELVFKEIQYEKGVLFLDEIDAIGLMREAEGKDNQEMKRVVNALLQLIDGFPNEGILLGATNLLSLLDGALVRRFQAQLGFELPSDKALEVYYAAILQRFPAHLQPSERWYGISYAEAKDRALRAVKKLVIEQAQSENI